VALRRDEAASKPGFRVVHGRGRPPKSYPRLRVAPADDERLSKHLQATVLRDGYPLKGLPAQWYVPAADERLGDRLTLQWMADYRAEHPDDWKRMLRTLRKLGGSTTWTQATAHRKATHEVPDQVIGESVLSDGDESVYLADLAHLMGLYPGINGAQKLQPFNRDGAYIDLNEITRDEITSEGENRLTARECLAAGNALSAEVKRRRFDAEIRAILDAIARDEREFLEALRGLSPWLEVLLGELYRLWKESQPIYVTFIPINEERPVG
jgi:hypothetical protein